MVLHCTQSWKRVPKLCTLTVPASLVPQPSNFQRQSITFGPRQTPGVFDKHFQDTVGHLGHGIFSALGRTEQAPPHQEDDTCHISPVSGFPSEQLSPDFRCVQRTDIRPMCSRTNEILDLFDDVQRPGTENTAKKPGTGSEQ